jgi:hypothetical protein
MRGVRGAESLEEANSKQEMLCHAVQRDGSSVAGKKEMQEER